MRGCSIRKVEDHSSVTNRQIVIDAPCERAFRPLEGSGLIGHCLDTLRGKNARDHRALEPCIDELTTTEVFLTEISRCDSIDTRKGCL